MTTVMSLLVGGRSLRRCDSACYGASGGRCDCICGGKNHGVGLEKALANTSARAEAQSKQPALHVPLPFGLAQDAPLEVGP